MDEKTAELILLKDFVMVAPSETLAHVVGQLRKHRLPAAVVYDGKYLGITSREPFLRSHEILSSEKVGSAVMSTPALGKSTTLMDTAAKMYNSNVRLLPVLENGAVVGIVRTEDVAKELASLPELKKLTAADVGTRVPISIRGDAKLSLLISLMRKNNIGRLPVVDVENRIIGVVGFDDILDKFLLKPIYREGASAANIRAKGFEPQRREALDIPISNFMTDRVITVSPTDAIPKVIDLMQRNNLADIVLARHGKLAGIITTRDILKAILGTVVEKRSLHLIGMPELDSVDRAIFERSIAETYDKLERVIGKPIELSLHVKCHEVEGAKRRYSVDCRVNSAGLNAAANSAKQWKFLQCAQDALKTLETDIIKKIKKPMNPKPRSPA